MEIDKYDVCGPRQSGLGVSATHEVHTAENPEILPWNAIRARAIVRVALCASDVQIEEAPHHEIDTLHLRQLVDALSI